MARWSQGWGFALRSFAGAALVGIGLAGCNKHGEPEAPRQVSETTAPAESPKDVSMTVPTPETKAEPAPGAFRANDPLHQPFALATYPDDDLPPNANRPPDDTIAGKPTHAVLQQVKSLWETIRFTTLDGKTIEYSALVETSEGSFEIELRPDAAPNHVRNFVALATAGFYDHLEFERVRVEKPDAAAAAAEITLEQIEAGNPRGAAEEINGTIGYWLRLEPSKLTHEEGTVGACLEGGPKSDGCRFYVTLSKAAYLDGNFTAFGKVKTGLDVARRIMTQPVAAEDRENDGVRRPEKPVVIKKVTIQTRLTGAAEGTK